MADGPRVGVLIPNLFLRIPIEEAVRARGAGVEVLADAGQAARSDCATVIVDLAALGGDPTASIRALVSAGKTVLGFGPHVQADLLARSREAGAVVLPRSAFLKQLPELLAAALGPAGGEP